MTLHTAFLSDSIWVSPLIQASDGAYYFAAKWTTASRFQIYKSASLAGSWALQGNLTISGAPLFGKIVGDVLHIAMVQSNTDIYHVEIDFLGNTITPTLVVTTTMGRVDGLAALDNGDLVIAYSDYTHKVMGVDRSDSLLARKSAGSWVSGITISPGGDVSYISNGVVKSASTDHVYVAYKNTLVSTGLYVAPVATNNAVSAPTLYTLPEGFSADTGLRMLSHSTASTDYVSFFYNKTGSETVQCRFSETGGSVDPSIQSSILALSEVFDGHQYAPDYPIHLAASNASPIAASLIELNAAGDFVSNTQLETVSSMPAAAIQAISIDNGSIVSVMPYRANISGTGYMKINEHLIQAAGSLIQGEVAELTLEALPGTVNHFIANVTQGEVAELSLEALQGTVIQNQRTVVAGEVAELSLEALAGTVKLNQHILGAVAEISLQPLAGSVGHHKHITGAVAELTLEALPGSIPSDELIIGSVAELSLEALSGNVFLHRTIQAETAELSLEALQGSVKADQLIVGQTAEISLEALQGSVQAGFATAGEVAEITLQALPGTVLHHKTIQADVAELTLEGLQGSVLLHRTIHGSTAELNLDALPGVVYLHRTITGEVAELALDPLAGLVRYIRHIQGQTAEITLEALPGTVDLILPPAFSIVGEVVEFSLEALPGTVIVRLLSYPDIPERTSYIAERPRETFIPALDRESFISANARESSI